MSTTEDKAKATRAHLNEANVGVDQITILRSQGPRLTKLWKADGTIEQYDDAAQFRQKTETVDGIKALSALLIKLEGEPKACIIRGRYVGNERAVQAEARAQARAAKEGKPLPALVPGATRRRNDFFDDQRLHTILIEVDQYQSAIDPIADPEAAIEVFIQEKLPAPFQAVACHWQLSSSAGHPTKGGELRAHIWFWLKTPYSSEELRAWARHEKLEIDASVFKQVQIHYTSRPMFEDGVTDPVHRRSGLIAGVVSDEVELDLSAFLAKRESKAQAAAEEAARKKAERAARAAGGNTEATTIEAFNARHSIEDLLTEHGFTSDGLGNWHWYQQDTGSYATRVYDGEDGQYWVSLSGTVASAGIGFETKSGARAGDAFDLLVHFTHKGDLGAAMGAASVATADDFEDLTNDPELLAAQAEWDAAQAAEAQEKQRHLDAFAPIIAASLAGRPVPPRKWHVPVIIPAGTVTGLAGNGGIGKSLLALQLAVATAIGGLWVGLECSKGRALYIGAEDDSDEMHGRLADICSAMSIEMADLTDLEIAPMAGFDTVLAEAKRSGKVEGTKLWQKVRAHVEATRPTLIVFDTLADLFAGDENVRTQAQQFVGLLRGLCVEFGATALLLTHPSLTGLASGTGLSGSTAWNNSVRSRLYLAKPDEAPEDTKLRVLRQVKNNYGTSGNVVATLVWSEGALHALSDDVQAGEDEAHRALARDAFLEAFGVNERAGLTVSPNRSASFAPTVFWKAAGGKKSVFSKEDFTTAMRELLEAGALAIATKGSASRETKILIRGKGKPPEEKMDLSTTTSKAAPNG